MIALGLSLASSSYEEAIAVQTQVLSVIVLPMSVGQLGSDDADVPAVVQRKKRPDACSVEARLMSPTENAVLAAQAATAITVQILRGTLLGLWRDSNMESTYSIFRTQT